ncbi:MAG: ribonuclease PH [Rickettsiales bacterium]|nr:ribonuclease PH [Rickettsiales bacterium]
MRIDQRESNQLRPIIITPNVSRHAEGSCLIACGNTQVRCTASVDENVPPWMRNSGKGWVTAEYGMLPRATHSRNNREAARGKQSGRTQEIQRLIGRALRSCIDLEALGERQITIDCDVLEADGGTRTASITGGFVALDLACRKLVAEGKVKQTPIITPIAAISCGIVGGVPMLDLCYEEDSAAQVDANFVMTGEGNMIEVQASGEEYRFSQDEFSAMLKLAGEGIAQLTQLQLQAVA